MSDPTIPGAPAPEPPSVQEPQEPHDPLPPKPDQGAPELRTATGEALEGEEGTARGQQGRWLTTATGVKLRDTDHSLKAGSRGPTLLQDHHLREKITHFDHERIPERVVHARGAAAHGYFEGYGTVGEICLASVFEEGRRTPTFVRFSTVLGSRGSADTVRDTRGFATKFYTDEGNWDLVGNNMPVFFIQDGIKFPDIIHAGKPHPDREIPQAQSAHDTFWDFVSLHTEAQHHTIWNMSDRGIPRSYRMMEGFGVHTFRVTNAEGATSLVKFHWKPKLGVHSLTWEEAQMLGGLDPDFHRRDLADAIEAGAFPEWELGVQVFPDTEDQTFHGIDLLDPTKLVPEEIAPVQPIGKMVLDRNPTNYFAETEQVAFHTGHLVPGIDVTDDPLLQARNFSYLDTQLSRLGGPNFNQLPINRPHAPVNDMLRDGMHQHAVHPGVAPYRPNSLDGGCPFSLENQGEDLTDEQKRAFVDAAASIEASRKVRANPASYDDHFSQARLFWLSLSPVEKEHVVRAYTFELGKCYEQAIKERQLQALANVDEDLCAQVAAGLGLPAPERCATRSSGPAWCRSSSVPAEARSTGCRSSGPSPRVAPSSSTPCCSWPPRSPPRTPSAPVTRRPPARARSTRASGCWWRSASATARPWAPPRPGRRCSRPPASTRSPSGSSSATTPRAPGSSSPGCCPPTVPGTASRRPWPDPDPLEGRREIMKAVTWQAPRKISVEEVPDPTIQEPTDAVVRITTTGLCGSDLHLYEPLAPFMSAGDVIGHEPMGIVEEVGPGVRDLAVGDRVVVPFNISCGSCWTCSRGLHSQCETTQNRDTGTGASLFGYSSLYGAVPGGQAELLRVPFADFLPMKVPHGPVDDRFVLLSDVLPTAWQGVEYAELPDDGVLLVMGAGPIGDMAARIAMHRGHRVLVADRERDRLARVAARGAETIDLNEVDDVAEEVRSRTGGRGADSVIDAVGMEAFGNKVVEATHKVVGLLPDALAGPFMQAAGIDRLAALHGSIDAVRRGGTVSLLGVYGGAVDPMPMMQMFDKQIQMRMGQANVRRWTDDIMPLLVDDADPLGTEDFVTHHLPLTEAPEAYQRFRDKEDGVVKVVFTP